MNETFTLHLSSVKHDSDGFKAGFSYKDESYISSIDEKYNSYKTTLTHSTLGLSKTVKDDNLSLFISKAQSVIDKWAAQWKKKYVTGALSQTINEKNEELDNILIHTIKVDDKIDFNLLKNKTPFEKTITYEEMVAELEKIDFPVKPANPVFPPKPDFIPPKISLIDKIAGKAKSMHEQSKNEYEHLVSEWQNEIEEIQKQYQIEVNSYNKLTEQANNKIDKLKKEISSQKEKYEREIHESNILIDKLSDSYKNKDSKAIEEYCEIVLNNSSYPDYFPKEFELEYNQDNQLLIVNYTLPSPDQIPKEKDVKFTISKNEKTSIYFSEKEFASRYNKILYMILLRTIHELFESDVINVIDYVCINGLINHLNKATGNYEIKCIATVSAEKNEFTRYNLQNIEPESCFKQLKGISATKLIDLTPVAPLLRIEKSDSRFIEAKDVLKDINDSVNLASMNWEEFEHLIREIFGKEFSLSGGEVKVTQSSRDGGVDAVAFDPDPIRGGKIIIQAKRYTNIVGVAAVRDLFGTVMNEGANKGIIVTTSYFGKDAYDFAKNKPLTLIDGSNLLYLLGKHGYRAKIDINEAKRFG